MALKTSIIMTGISIGLLVIYGIDVAVGGGEAEEGFLTLDAKTRGLGLGGPSIVLPIISFFISRKEPSKRLALMLIISGILILIGGAVAIGMANLAEDKEIGRRVMAEGGAIVGIGAFIIALGTIKLKKS